MKRLILIVVLCLSFSACQNSNFDWKSSKVAVSQVRVNTMFGDTLPFIETEFYAPALSGEDAVFLSGYIERLIQKSNRLLRQKGTTAKLLPVAYFADNNVYKQFPKVDQEGSLLLLPYYQKVDVSNASVYRLLSNELDVNGFLELDFHFYATHQKTFLQVKTRLFSQDDRFDWVFDLQVDGMPKESRPRPLSFKAGKEQLFLELLMQFEEVFLQRLSQQVGA